MAKDFMPPMPEAANAASAEKYAGSRLRLPDLHVSFVLSSAGGVW